MIRAVVFDLDDTLYPATECYEQGRLTLETFCTTHFQITRDQFNESFVKAKQIVKQQLGNTAASHNRMLYCQTLCELLSIHPLSYALKMYDMYWESAMREMVCYPFVRPLFYKLRGKNVKIGILTDLTAHIQYRKLKQLGIIDAVDAIVTSEEVGTGKPDPKMFARILEKLKIKPRETLMVGDNIVKDISGARSAGMVGYWVAKKRTDEVIKEILSYIDNFLETRG